MAGLPCRVCGSPVNFWLGISNGARTNTALITYEAKTISAWRSQVRRAVRACAGPID